MGKAAGLFLMATNLPLKDRRNTTKVTKIPVSDMEVLLALKVKALQPPWNANGRGKEGNDGFPTRLSCCLHYSIAIPQLHFLLSKASKLPSREAPYRMHKSSLEMCHFGQARLHFSRASCSCQFTNNALIDPDLTVSPSSETKSIQHCLDQAVSPIPTISTK